MPAPGTAAAAARSSTMSRTDTCRDRCRAARPARLETATRRRGGQPAAALPRRRPSAGWPERAPASRRASADRGPARTCSILRQQKSVVFEHALELRGEAVGMNKSWTRRAARSCLRRRDRCRDRWCRCVSRPSPPRAPDRARRGKASPAGTPAKSPAAIALRCRLLPARRSPAAARSARRRRRCRDTRARRAAECRRNQAQDGLLAADDERVAGVMAALKADHALRVLGQPVDDFALAFIAPLRADDDDVLAHRDHALRSASRELPQVSVNPVAGRARPTPCRCRRNARRGRSRWLAGGEHRKARAALVW